MDMNISVDGGDIYAGHRVANGHLSAMINRIGKRHSDENACVWPMVALVI